MVRRVVSVSVLCVIVVVFLYAAITLGKHSTAAEVGDLAPDFTLQDMKANKVRLSDYREQFVILNFFTTWCPPCREEAPELQAFQERYGDQVKLLILDRAEPKINVQKFIEEFHSTSTFLLDINDSMSKPYGVTGQPETFFIDKEGIIRLHYIGPMTQDFIVETTNKFKKVSLK